MWLKKGDGNDFRIEYSRMSRDLYFLEIKKGEKEKAGIGIEQLGKDKRIFAVYFSKQVGLVKFVFDLKKKIDFVTREIFW